MSQHEEEQLEEIKRFWQDYGTPILMAGVLVAAVALGWQYWQKNRMDQSTQASMAYQDLLTAAQKLQMNPTDTASNTELQSKGQKIMQDFSGSPVAINAGLILAKRAVDTGDLKEAEKQLKWVLDQKPEEGVRIIASVRLARVLSAKGDNNGALALLAKEDAAAFAPTVQEARADIYQAMGKSDDARKAYTAADAALKDRDQQRPLLEMKMADAGVAPAPRDDKDQKAAN